MQNNIIEAQIPSRATRLAHHKLHTVIFLCLVTLITLGGFLIYDQVSDSKEAIAQLNAQVDALNTELTALDASTEHYLNVPEWGMKVPQNATRDLWYKVSSNDVITFGSSTLDKTCKGSGVTLVRAELDATTTLFNETGTKFKDIYESFTSENIGVALKIADHYYLYPLHGPSACTLDPDGDATLRADIQEHLKLMRVM